MTRPTTTPTRPTADLAAAPGGTGAPASLPWRRGPFGGHRRSTGVAAGVLAAAVLGACGGGGSDGSGDAGGQPSASVTNEQAQGYGADAMAMPLSAGSTADLSTATLQQAVRAASQSGSQRACAGGGSVAWAATGANATLLGNGEFDAGERYDAVFNACRSTAGTLEGRAIVQVRAAAAGQIDVDVEYQALIFTAATGPRFTLGGTTRQQRTTTTDNAGITTTSNRITAAGPLTLATLIATRQANYELRNVDWTVIRDTDAGGMLQSRRQQGALQLTANSARRSVATLEVQTTAALVQADDGFATQGSYTVSNGRDRWTVTYGGAAGTGATIALDLGADGSVDRTWTLTRTQLTDEIG